MPLLFEQILFLVNLPGPSRKGTFSAGQANWRQARSPSTLMFHFKTSRTPGLFGEGLATVSNNCISSIIRGKNEGRLEGAKRPTAGDEPREFISRGEGRRVPPFSEK